MTLSETSKLVMLHHPSTVKNYNYRIYVGLIYFKGHDLCSGDGPEYKLGGSCVLGFFAPFVKHETQTPQYRLFGKDVL